LKPTAVIREIRDNKRAKRAIREEMYKILDALLKEAKVNISLGVRTLTSDLFYILGHNYTLSLLI
jgi:hypothetical protein